MKITPKYITDSEGNKTSVIISQKRIREPIRNGRRFGRCPTI